MKRMIAMLLAAVLCLSLAAMAIAEEGDPTIEEGYTTEGDGWTSVVSWCKNGELNI